MFRFEGLDKSKHFNNPHFNISRCISIDLTILIFIQSAFAKTSKNNINFNKYMVK